MIEVLNFLATTITLWWGVSGNVLMWTKVLTGHLDHNWLALIRRTWVELRPFFLPAGRLVVVPAGAS